MIRKISTKRVRRIPMNVRVPDDLRPYQEAKRDMQWAYARWTDILRDYAGKCIAVANRELFVADNINAAYQQARARYPRHIPFVFAVSAHTGKRIR